MKEIEDALEKKLMSEAESMDDSIFKLFSENILTFYQRRCCDKRLRKWTQQKNIKYNKKIRKEF